MVTLRPAGRLLGRLRDAVRRDWAGLSAAAAARLPVRPGLYRYEVHPPGGTRQIHLRIDRNGGGVLWIDVADVIHLNPTAALLARLALGGTPPDRAVAVLRGRFGDTPRAEHDRAVQQIYTLVDHLRTTTAACPTCDLQRLAGVPVRTAPLFSTAVEAPYKADLALSYGCNNACRHCYNPAPRADMPSLTIRQWFRVLRKLRQIGIPQVIFTGGEPTLVDGLDRLIREGGLLGLVTGINTNGRRLAGGQLAETLARAGLNHVQVTLESHRAAVHDAMTGAASFDETVAGIRNARAAGLHTITNTTLTRQNADHAVPTVDFLHGLGLTTFAMNAMIHAGGGCDNGETLPEDELAEVLADVRDRAASLAMRFLWYTPTAYCRLSPIALQLGPRRCNAGEYSLCIEPDGGVLPCQSYYSPVGNILRDPWPAIWNSALFRSFRDRTADPQRCGLPSACWKCPELPLCAGGCRLEREHGESGAEIDPEGRLTIAQRFIAGTTEPRISCISSRRDG